MCDQYDEWDMARTEGFEDAALQCVNGNSYNPDDPNEAELWQAYEDGYQAGMEAGELGLPQRWMTF